MSVPKARAAYRRRLRRVADEVNHVPGTLDAILARVMAPKEPRRPVRPPVRPEGRTCVRCLEERPASAFPPDDRPDGDERMRDPGWCVSCLSEARDVERVRRLDQHDLDAWAACRIAGGGLVLEPWGHLASCAHCGVRLPQSPAYVWACRHGWGAGVCDGLLYPHVHAVCRWCAYEGIYDTPEGDGKRRIA